MIVSIATAAGAMFIGASALAVSPERTASAPDCSAHVSFPTATGKVTGPLAPLPYSCGINVAARATSDQQSDHLSEVASAARSATAAPIERHTLPAKENAVDPRVRSLLDRMTVREKLGQLVQYFYVAKNAQATTSEVSEKQFDVDAAIARGEVGSLLLVTDPEETNRLQRIAVEQSRLKIPLLFAFDVIHGFKTIMPVPLALAATWDPETARRAQAVAAAEARSVGISWTFAPMIDIARDPRWGRILEGAGEDPVLASAMAAAQVRGFQGDTIGAEGHIISGPKHFAGYGASIGGRDYDEVDLSEEKLRNVYFPPFKAAVEAGAGNIMSAYMSLNGVPAAANHRLFTKVLREEWGFPGFVVTDANGVRSLTRQGVARSSHDAAAKALAAGIDMAMEFPSAESPMLALEKALSDGELDIGLLDAAVSRILQVKFAMGLFDNPFVDPQAAREVMSDPDHREIARAAAERAAVLLRNQDRTVPLDEKKLQSVAVLGPLASSWHDALGPWVFPGPKPSGISILEGIKHRFGDKIGVSYSPGVPMPQRTNKSFFDNINPPVPLPDFEQAGEFRNAVEQARAADVAILVLGEPQNMAGEAASRQSLALPGRQQELLDAVIATGTPVVVVLMSARPLDLGGAEPDAILQVWYPGSEAGNAVANLLAGDAVPGGKLPFSWIRSAAQAPYSYDMLPSHAPTLQDRRYWDVETSSPKYEFGFGLSYTTFAYSDLGVSAHEIERGQSVTVSVDVTNTGERAGDEVPQLYLHQRVGTSSRPVRQLKKFERITLAPGETRRVGFTLLPDDMRYWSDVTGDWTLDSSIYDIWVGGSSAASLHGEFNVID